MKLFYKNEYLFSEIYLKEIAQIEKDVNGRLKMSHFWS